MRRLTALHALLVYMIATAATPPGAVVVRMKRLIGALYHIAEGVCRVVQGLVVGIR